MSAGPSHGLTNPNASPENGLLDVAGVPPTPPPSTAMALASRLPSA